MNSDGMVASASSSNTKWPSGFCTPSSALVARAISFSTPFRDGGGSAARGSESYMALRLEHFGRRGDTRRLLRLSPGYYDAPVQRSNTFFLFVSLFLFC